jgi:hypothetical protein
MSRIRAAAGATLFLMLLQPPACASRDSPGSAPQRSDRATAQPERSGTPAGDHLSGLGQPTEVVPGAITITPSAADYERGSPISAIIGNGLRHTIYTEDLRSDCSILFLERQDATGWQQVPGCNVRRSPATVAIGSSRGRTVVIDPSSDAFLAVLGPSEVPLHEGTYRFTLTYQAGASGQSLSVSSTAFQISS